MGDIILYKTPTDLTSSAGQQFVRDACRAAEGLISDQELMEKYEITSEDFKAIATNKSLIRAIQNCREQRLISGAAAREAAARHFIKAPAVLDQIMSDERSNPRHKIEAIKELRQTAHGNTSENAAADGTKFHIVINLGDDHIERFEKEISPVKPSLPTNEVNIDGE